MWDLPAGAIGGRVYSLREIEHGQLRRRWREPGIHACLARASRGGPDLGARAFEARQLAAQIDERCRAWLEDASKGARVDRARGELVLSRLLLWYEADWARPGDTRAWPAVEWAVSRLPPDDAVWVRENWRRVRVRFFEHDWALNSQRDADII